MVGYRRFFKDRPCSRYRVKNDEKQFQHRELARSTGTKVETIRYYERIRLLPPPARRAYADGHLARLSFIHRRRALGFSLDDIRELLRLSDDRDRSCADVDRIARVHLMEVERKLAICRRSASNCGSLSNNASTALSRNAG
jgi:DNA-binding transcriptional MerR regulator